MNYVLSYSSSETVYDLLKIYLYVQIPVTMKMMTNAIAMATMPMSNPGLSTEM